MKIHDIVLYFKDARMSVYADTGYEGCFLLLNCFMLVPASPVSSLMFQLLSFETAGASRGVDLYSHIKWEMSC